MTNDLPEKPATRRVPNFRRQAGKRDEIIAAALEVFSAKGYEQGRLEDVARLSGIGKSAVLYHFGSKLGLVASVVVEHCLPAIPVGPGAGDELIETSFADPAATKVLRFVMTEQRRLPSLGRLYVRAIVRRVSSWQGFDSIEAVRVSVGQAFGRVAARVLFEDIRSTMESAMAASPQFEIVHDLLDLAGAKWTIDVVATLRDNRMRFNEIAHAVDGISQKQLTSTLRSLQRHGFAFRVAFATIPPRVEYELTELGHDFALSIVSLGAFAVRNQNSIEAARRDFDAA